MARQLETYSNVEVRGTVRFLWAKRFTSTEIHREILAVYGPHAMSRPAIVKWCQRFEDGRTDLTDSERKGRPTTVSTSGMVQRVEDIILSNRRVSVAHIAQELGISVGSAHSIVRHQLDYRKLCSRWVPYSLSSEHKGARFAASVEFLQRYSAEGNDFLSRIITGDETWVHHFTQETKQASREWRHTSSPVRTKSKVPPSAAKVMATVFFDCEGVVYTEFMRKGTTINAESYCETLRGLRKAVKNKRRGKLSKGIVLLHDNARPHKARTTQGLLRSFGWEVWQHPPYSPDLAPCDFHVFGKLKEHLGGKQFSNDDQVQTAVLSWLQDQGAIFYRQGIERLVQRSDKCLQRLGDYVEK